MTTDRKPTLALDGNAAGGLLSELFACEMTVAELTCAGCGAVSAIGAMPDYGGSMGAILRCAHCDTAVLRMTHTPAGLWLDMQGAPPPVRGAARDRSCTPPQGSRDVVAVVNRRTVIVNTAPGNTRAGP